MTPLAQRIVKELTLPVKRRTFNDQADLSVRMVDVHCFECSDIVELASDAGEAALRGDFDGRTTFLPAPNTWIEWLEDGDRVGVLLTEKRGPDGPMVAGYTVAISGNNIFGATRAGVLPLGTPACMGTSEISESRKLEAMLYGFLACINTPRIIGRRQHMPHRGLERRLTQALGVQGSFPLNAWTEIKLQVAPPKDMSGDGSTEAHLTGQRALHFCRAHLRIRLGRLEVVRSHWRGDASLGLRQSRYRLTGAPA